MTQLEMTISSKRQVFDLTQTKLYVIKSRLLPVAGSVSPRFGNHVRGHVHADGQPVTRTLRPAMNTSKAAATAQIKHNLAGLKRRQCGRDRGYTPVPSPVFRYPAVTSRNRTQYLPPSQGATMFDFCSALIEAGQITKTSVPRASIIWLARTVKVERPLRPASPPLTALASQGGMALRMARLECACLVQKAGDNRLVIRLVYAK